MDIPYYKYIPSCNNKALSPNKIQFLKDEIIVYDEGAIQNLLSLPGFTTDFNAFKFSGPIIGHGQSSMYLFNTGNRKGCQVDYGHSTSMVSETVG